jgi:hypothetical protein
MPTNRTTINRPRRPTRPDDDALEIFRRLENTPRRQRQSAAFLAEDLRLHQLLDLYSARRCSICSVLDRSAAPLRPADMPAAKDWHRVHAVRVELLAALAADAPRLGETAP